MNPSALVFIGLVAFSSVLVGLTLRRGGAGLTDAGWPVFGVAACSAAWAVGAGGNPIGRPIPDAVFASADCVALVFAGATASPTALSFATFGACRLHDPLRLRR